MARQDTEELAREESIHNYYEDLVRNAIVGRGVDDKFDSDTLQDILCTALNRLPPKYIRSEVNLLFFLSDEERVRMAQRVSDALDFALAQVAKRAGGGVEVRAHDREDTTLASPVFSDAVE